VQEIMLSEIAKELGATLSYDAAIREVVTDSRECGEGKLFVALVGDRADGNDYVASALEKGAAAAVATRIAPGVDPARVILVSDGRRAMIRIGALVRSRFSIPFVGVTGSVGKTTTKEFIHAVLSAKYHTHKNQGNQNDEVGLPNTLFALEPAHEAAVVEMGMCGLGQIHDLTMAVRPTVGVITSIGTSHLEFLGTRENILRAKLEIRDGMPDGAPLFLCGDNDLLASVCDDRLRVIFYGITNPECAIRATDIEEKDGETHFSILSPWGEYAAKIPTIGRHNVLDALAAFGVGCVMGVTPERAAQALFNYLPTGMRQKITSRGGVTVVEDCYNCSPDSLKAAILTLASYPTKGKHILVLSDMLELGEQSAALHRACGQFAAKQGIDLLLSFGPMSRHTVDGAAEAGLERAVWYETKQELADALRRAVRTGDVVWFKASRGQRLEEVIQTVYGEEETT
jgi:UDP-N-acetylmuramoyl-tripeptide--D-alanyl-D-alanine ligase